jgi:uncharacterized protein (DUF2141 family)
MASGLLPPKPLNKMKAMKRSLWGLAAGLALMLMGLPAWAADLKVNIGGVRSSAGAVMIGLYDSPEHFKTAIDKASEVGTLNDEARLGGVALRAIAGTQSVVFTNLNPGRYAVIVFHDENDNGKLDKNFWGVPLEGYGFSNNAQGSLGPPDFKEVAITLDEADKEISISLIYPAPAEGGLKMSPDNP